MCMYMSAIHEIGLLVHGKSVKRCVCVCAYGCVCVCMRLYVCVRLYICVHTRLYVPSNKKFNCLQTTPASIISQRSLQTVPYVLL